MGLKRRAFLQQASLTLAALGMSEAGLARLGDRYYRALADTTPRKLALLVGINQYPESMGDRAGHGTGLTGCVTDVELQRELLIHRFGFHNRDILTLSDRQATRQNIETAFVSHLIEQAQPGDIVIFHFSGYGSRVQPHTPTEPPQSSLVPVDGWSAKDDLLVNDLSEETLLLLLRSLETNRVTTVLDTSYLYPGSALQGNLRLRARPKPTLASLNPEAIVLQEQLLSKLKSSREQVGVERRSGQLPGVVLAAASTDETSNAMAAAGNHAFETQWNGFSAGLFTYALTQYLWAASTASTTQVSFNRATIGVEQVVGREQHPMLKGQQSREQSLLSYYLAPSDRLGAEGVLTSVEDDGKSGQLWLGGLPSHALESYGLNAVFTVAPSPAIASSARPSAIDTLASTTTADPPILSTLASPPVQLQITSRNGLTAKAKLYGSSDEVKNSQLQAGQLVQESVRIIPRNLNLAIALDSTLERIERVDATSAFSAIPHVTLTTAGEQPADLLFGRVNRTAINSGEPISSAEISGSEPIVAQAISSELTLSSRQYGLFSPGKELIANTLGEGGEAVKAAIQRLLPHMKTQLAAKLLRLTANENSSRLGVQASLELLTSPAQTLLQRDTARAPWLLANSDPATSPIINTGIPTLPIGSRIRYRLLNYSDRPVYFIVLGLDSSGNLIAVYSSQTASTEDAEAKPKLQQEAIAPKTTIIFPKPGNSLEWAIRGPAGLTETYIIFSRQPFIQTLATLETAMRPMGEVQRISTPNNPLEVVQAIVQDLHQASATTLQSITVPPDNLALDVNAWVTLGFLHHIAEVKRLSQS